MIDLTEIMRLLHINFEILFNHVIKYQKTQKFMIDTAIL